MGPTFADARELLEWRPRLGVISVYLAIDPADRGGAWQTRLRNGLGDLVAAGDGRDHDLRVALKATAERVAERFAESDRSNLPRGQVGFVEVSAGRGEERWWATHLPPLSPATAYLSAIPVLAPLVGLAGRGGPRGVAILSAERVRLFERVPGRLEELRDWELSLTSGDWRERNAPAVADPARSSSVSASGHDQFDERLAANRRRFLSECGRLARQAGSDRAWPLILAFGSPPEVAHFRDGIPSSASPSLENGAAVDLISEPAGVLREQVEQAFARVDAERDRRLVERVLEETRSGSRGTAGAQGTAAALAEGRVECLVLAAGLTPLVAPFDAGPGPADDGDVSAGSEPLVRRALRSGAEVTVVAEEAADLLEPFDGVAALLRY